MTDSLFIHYLVLWKPLGYFFIFLGTIFEGDVTLFTGAFLSQENVLNLQIVILAALLGAFIGDTCWYWIGYYLGDYSLVAKRWLDNIAEPFDYQLSQNPMRSIFVSKFIYGINHATLVRAGNLRMPFRKFFIADAAAIICWAVLITSIGYASGASFDFLKHYLRFAEVVLLGGIIAILVATHFFRRMYDKKYE